MNQQPTRTPRRSRRRASGRNYWPWVLAVAAFAALFVAWPVDAYGEGALWGLKRTGDDSLRAPIVGVFASAEQSGGDEAGEGLQVVTNPQTVGETSAEARRLGIVANPAPEERAAFYGLLARCGGAEAVQDSLMTTFIGAKLEDAKEEYRLDMARQGFSNASAKLVKHEYGWVVATSARHPIAEIGTIKAEELLVLHLSEGKGTPTGDGSIAGNPWDDGATSLDWEIKLGSGMFAKRQAAGTINADCSTH